MRSGDELNPFLGWRAIRFCLENLDIFKAQLRAILRASVGTNVKMMFPMISGLDEVRRGLQIVDECRSELRREGHPFHDELEIGVMIEVPTAAIMADLLAREVDFFSIGTNDLIQYSVAIDRTNERVAHLYEPSHPSVVRLLKMVADAAHANDIWVGVCGEMAGEILFTPLLLGLGMDELSAGTSLVPRVKSAVQRLSVTECQKLVEEVLELDTPAAVLARCTEMATRQLWRTDRLSVGRLCQPQSAASLASGGARFDDTWARYARRYTAQRERNCRGRTTLSDSASPSGSISGLMPSSSILRSTSLMSSTSSQTSWLT